MAAMISCASSGSAGRRARRERWRQVLGHVLGTRLQICGCSRAASVEKSGDPVSYAQPMTRTAKIANLLTVVLPPLIILAASSSSGTRSSACTTSRWPGVMYLADGLRRDRRLSPHAHPPLVPDLQAGRVLLRRGRLDGGPGAGHQLGRRPPQAPRPHRRGGRSALAPRRRRQRASGARSRGLLHAHVGWLHDRARPRRAREVRPRPRRGPRDALRRPGVRRLGPARPRRCPPRWAG